MYCVCTCTYENHLNQLTVLTSPDALVYCRASPKSNINTILLDPDVRPIAKFEGLTSLNNYFIHI